MDATTAVTTSFQTWAGNVLQRLQNSEADKQFEAVKTIKNAVIGNKNKKNYLVNVGAVPLFLHILRSSSWEPLQVQATVVLGSFALGNADNVAVVIASGAVEVLLRQLLSQQPKLVEASARSLKFILQAHPNLHIDLLTDDVLVQIIERLNADAFGLSVAELVASVLARCCVTLELQEKIVAYGGLATIVRLLGSSHAKAQEAALDALVVLSVDNPRLIRQLTTLEVSPNVSPIAYMMQLVKDPRPQTRLLAATCLTNVVKSIKDPAFIEEVKLLVLPTLVKLLDAPLVVQERAPLVLANLVSESETFQTAASDTDAITKLAAFVKAPDESVSTKLRETSLLAMAAICLQKEECRKQVIDSKILPHVILALSHPDPAVRAAACQLSRSLSRSVKMLRTSLVDSGIAISLFQLLSDSDLTVQRVACATICNIVLDFSPMKKAILENGGVQKLVLLAQSSDTPLRLNSVWALKNLVCDADAQTKDLVMSELTYPRLLNLLQDNEPSIQEQALNLLRNLAAGKSNTQESQLQKIFDGLGSALEPMLEAKLNSPSHDTLLQTMYVVVNMATGNQAQKQFIMSQERLLRRISELMSHSVASVRVAAIWCVINLTYLEDPGVQDRIAFLRRFGFEDTLRSMVHDPDQDVKDRVKTALDNFLSEAEKVSMDS